MNSTNEAAPALTQKRHLRSAFPQVSGTLSFAPQERSRCHLERRRRTVRGIASPILIGATEEQIKGARPNPPNAAAVAAIRSSHFPFGCHPPCTWKSLSFIFPKGIKRIKEYQRGSPHIKTKGSTSQISGTPIIFVSAPHNRNSLPLITRKA